MSRIPRPVRCSRIVLLGALASMLAAAPARATTIQPDFAAPTVLLSRYEVAPGDEIDVTVAGFTSRTVTITVCGNRALRGSGDCDMTASESGKMNEDGSSRVVRLVATAPPTPCPCLVRVSSPNNDQVATAELTLIGHPVAEPVAGGLAIAQLAASVSAERAGGGLGAWLRSSLGGSTAYDVTVTVRNTSTDRVGQVAVSGDASGGDGDVRAEIALESPGSIGPGETWERAVRVELPAPVFGNTRWTVDVANAGPTVTTTDDTSHLPGLLLLLTLLAREGGANPNASADEQRRPGVGRVSTGCRPIRARGRGGRRARRTAPEAAPPGRRG